MKKILLLAILLSGCETVSLMHPYKEEFNRFKNETVYTSQTISAGTGEKYGELVITATCACAGHLCKPDSVMLLIQTRNDQWVFQTDHDLYLIVDDERSGMLETYWDGSFGSSGGDPVYYENIDLTVSGAYFLKLCQAKLVEGRIGKTEFALPLEARAPFRELWKNANR